MFVGAVSFFGGHNHAGEAAQTTANYSFDVTTQIAAEVKKLGGSFSAASLFVVVTAKQGDQDVRMPNGHEIELRIKVSSTNS